MTSILRGQQPRGRRHRTPAVPVIAPDAADATVVVRQPGEPSDPDTMFWPQDGPWHLRLATFTQAILDHAPEGWVRSDDPQTDTLSFIQHLLHEVDRLGGSLEPPWCQRQERGTYGVLPQLLTERPDLAYVLNPHAPVPAPTGTGEAVSGTGSKPASPELAGTPGPETADTKSSGPVPTPPCGAGPDSGTEGEPENEQDRAEGES